MAMKGRGRYSAAEPEKAAMAFVMTLSPRTADAAVRNLSPGPSTGAARFNDLGAAALKTGRRLPLAGTSSATNVCDG
jgi:hypothetical protein